MPLMRPRKPPASGASRSWRAGTTRRPRSRGEISPRRAGRTRRGSCATTCSPHLPSRRCGRENARGAGHPGARRVCRAGTGVRLVQIRFARSRPEARALHAFQRSRAVRATPGLG